MKGNWTNNIVYFPNRFKVMDSLRNLFCRRHNIRHWASTKRKKIRCDWRKWYDKGRPAPSGRWHCMRGHSTAKVKQIPGSSVVRELKLQISFGFGVRKQIFRGDVINFKDLYVTSWATQKTAEQGVAAFIRQAFVRWHICWYW